jgi:hypothetical protein
MISIYTLIQKMNILGYAQHGGTTNNGLRINSRTNLEIIGPKIPSPLIIRQMLDEAFSDLVSLTSHESFNVFT